MPAMAPTTSVMSRPPHAAHISASPPYAARRTKVDNRAVVAPLTVATCPALPPHVNTWLERPLQPPPAPDFARPVTGKNETSRACRRGAVAPRASGLKTTDVTRHEYRLNLKDIRPPRVKLDEGLSVRNPGPDDIESLAALVLNAFRGTLDDEGEDLDAARQFVMSSFAEEAIVAASWLALDGREPVSAIMIRRWKGHPLVTFVVTHPDYRKRKLALALTERAINTLLDEGEARVVAFITEGNTASEGLFTRLGFERRHSSV
jgi:ribosomal protein S18 acetylase RimI-like enzyme